MRPEQSSAGCLLKQMSRGQYQVEILFANERHRPRSGRVGPKSKESSLDSLHEMSFDEDALQRAVKDLVHKYTEEKTLE
jgi:hypothetical protein